jgi:hypothetical protein
MEGNHGGKGTGAGARRNLEMMTGTWRVLRGRERVTDRWALFRPCREGNYSFFFLKIRQATTPVREVFAKVHW